jgi:5-methylcytosine-specific restriction endonuclease McrA
MVLVLAPKTWEPMHIKSVRDAIKDVAKGVAEILDADNNTYDWDLWTLMEPGMDEPTIHTTRQRIRVPEIIVLTKPMNGKRKHRDIKLTRKNIFLRDCYECQYCSKIITLNSGTVDHIFPKSRGGKNSWDNLVAACFKCNSKKKNRTPQEAGITLRSTPHKPKWYPLSTRLTPGVPKRWSDFMPDETKIPAYLTRNKE